MHTRPAPRSRTSRRGRRGPRCAPRTSRWRCCPEEARGGRRAVDIGRSSRPTPTTPTEGCELVFVLGGDGTILRGAEMSRGTDVPLLGVNLGHVGFLAEAEREDLHGDRRAHRQPGLHGRGADDPRRRCRPGRRGGRARSWALNEVSVEKAARERMLEVAVEIDGRPLSTFGCDGIVGRPRRGRRPTPSRRAARWSGRTSRRC